MKRTGLALGVAMLAVTARSEALWKPDAFFGTWALVATKSHYAHAQPPERMTLVIEPSQEGLAYRSQTQYSGGRTASSQFIAGLDNAPALVVGTSGFLAPVSLSPSTDGGIDATYKSGIKKVASSHWTVSADGRELIITTTYLGVQGEEERNVVAFRRADPVEGGTDSR